MKKNRMMRLASVLLVMVLLSTSVISGTFAKYTTTDSASDSARVAKWGVEVEVGGNLFGQYYAKNADTTNPDQIVAAAATSVDTSIAGEDIVAPGTKNEEGFTVSISGTPEVSYQVIAANVGETKDILLGEGHWGVMVVETGVNEASDIRNLYTENASNQFVKNGDTAFVEGELYYELHDYVEVTTDYYPLKWKVDPIGVVNHRLSATNLVEIANELARELSRTGNANVPTDYGYKLTWEWPFSVSPAQDKMDTILGNLAADTAVRTVYSEDGIAYEAPTDGEDYNLIANLDFAITVEQTD